jgi:hypothetical protein
MNSNSCLMQQVLGNDWEKLPLVIRRHYQITPEQNSFLVTGTMVIDFPFWIKPLLKIIRLMGALIDNKGENNHVKVQKWLTDDSQILYWRREIQTANGQQTIFASQMEFQRLGELIEFVGGGFGIRLKLSVEDGQLIYRSDGHLLKIGKFILPIADYFALGKATIIERALTENSFALDFQIIHPLLGKTYTYNGVFYLN